MLLTGGKRLAVAMMGVAIAGVAALSWFSISRSRPVNLPAEPIFAQITLSGKQFAYVRIQGSKLRVARSVEGLKTSVPLELRAIDADDFETPEFTLPVPADQLPAGAMAIKASLGLEQIRRSSTTAPAPWIYGRFALSRIDERKAEWQYLSQGGVPAAAEIDKAASLKLPDLTNVKAAIETKAAKGRLAIGLRISAGDATLTEVRKGGSRQVEAKMTVTDASGNEAASRVGKLSDFGFS